MNKFTSALAVLLLFQIPVLAQQINLKLRTKNQMPANNVGINTTAPDSSAVLDIVSTDKGVLIPRMTLSQRDNISSPATGLLVFQSDGTPGFYYYDGTIWRPLVGNSSSGGEDVRSLIYTVDGF